LALGVSPSTVSRVVLGLGALLQPLEWVGPLIPVLPLALLDIIESPVPVLVGLPLPLATIQTKTQTQTPLPRSDRGTSNRTSAAATVAQQAYGSGLDRAALLLRRCGLVTQRK
jgi:hypothetical protein